MDPTAILSSAVVAAVVAGLIASQGTDLGFRVRPYDGVAMLRQVDDELIAKDPAGYGKAFDDVAATFDTDLRTLTQLWRGDHAWPQVLRSGLLRLEAPTQTRRALPRWLKLSAFAPVPRPA